MSVLGLSTSPALSHLILHQTLHMCLLNCFNCVQLFFDPKYCVACQAPLAMGFSRQEYCSELPYPLPGDPFNPGIRPTSLMSPALAGGFFAASATWEAHPLNLQFSSVAQSCPTLRDSMNRSTPGLPVHHQLPEFTQTHVHRVGDAIQSSHPLLYPSPPAPNPSQHQSLFQ